jgi:hypothetical protein
MTAGAVQNQMGVHELMCWHHLLTERPDDTGKRGGGVVLSVKDEIAAWG